MKKQRFHMQTPIIVTFERILIPDIAQNENALPLFHQTTDANDDATNLSVSHDSMSASAHEYPLGENFMAIFTTLSVVIWFSTGTLGIIATVVYVFTMRMVLYDILSMAIILTLSTSILFCNLCYILL